MNKRKRIISLLCSIIIWGSGQFFVCKQRIKGLLLFVFQLIFIGTELFTGYWLEALSGQIQHFSFRLHGGFFTKGIWGLVTLGEREGGINGDHSTMLMITGIIAILVLIVVGGINIFNLYDAYKTGRLLDETGHCPTTKEYFKSTYSRFFAYIILVPIVIYITFIVIMPIIFAILTAFTNYNANHLPPGNLVKWVGFDNFKKLFQIPIWSSTFFLVLRWTVVWAVLATFSTFFFGMLQAILLNSKYTKCKTFYRGMMILPWAIPQLISLLVFRNLLNGQFGPVSKLLMDLGLTDHRIAFLSDPFIAKVTILVVNLWLGFPMFMIMIQGILSNIDKSLYEAAEIDGGGGFKIFRYITLPLVLRATAPLIVMNLAGNFNGFGIIYFLTNGGPVNTNYQFAGDTDILISWIYKLTLDQKLYDMAAVMNIMIFIMIAGVSIWNFRRTQAFKEV
ncbi:carbohydrate ABC transporter permease [Anaeromicropila herbilytica]|uniref:Maltose/maltodextrin transport system permease protein n=1 Tax=Anaeromicropila herbilytica TaxID=2785025 RepID=A0A7R7IF22_9FIRM|nr:sugar ABC transporter permease [Anaeromicropila herbilytica]BCN32646.1 sugar ABC transporter permease [Anaeromicropila herbilytica]